MSPPTAGKGDLGLRGFGDGTARPMASSSRAFSWVRMCRVKLLDLLNFLSHSSQGYPGGRWAV